MAQALSDRKAEYELCPACWVAHHSEFAPDDLADAMWDMIHKHRGELEQAEILRQELEDRIKSLEYDLRERDERIDELKGEVMEIFDSQQGNRVD